MKNMEELKKMVKAKGLDVDQAWESDQEIFWSIVRDLRFWFEYGVNVSEEGVQEFNRLYMELRKELKKKVGPAGVDRYCQKVVTVVSFTDL